MFHPLKAIHETIPNVLMLPAHSGQRKKHGQKLSRLHIPVGIYLNYRYFSMGWNFQIFVLDTKPGLRNDSLSQLSLGIMSLL